MTKPVCAVIGVGPGNGAAFASKFADNGYRVALLARNEEYLAELAGELVGAVAYLCDVTDTDALTGALARIRDELGPVSVLNYNAGAGQFCHGEDTSVEAFEQPWRIYALGCFVAARAVIDDMRELDGPSIIVIGATASLRGGANFTTFASAKAAQRSLAQSMARHLGPDGIHVAYVVIDGVVDLPRTRAAMPDKPDEFFLRPEDIAESVSFLARQPRSAWTFELDVRPHSERW